MRTFFILALFAFALRARPEEVVQVSWPTTHAAEPTALTPAAANLLPAFRLAMHALPESATVALALSQPGLVGLTAEEAGHLQPLTTERYRLMSQAPAYLRAPSALPYCFAEKKTIGGLATVYIPDGVTANSPVIVFLHGYGGSFLWYQHYLSESLPRHIIICPAYGITTANIPQTYVTESMAAVSKHLGFSPATPPCLIGLSAGGFGACRLYVAAPRLYAGLICLASYPPDDTVYRFTRDAQPRFLSGGNEPFVTSGDFRQRIARIRQACPATEADTIPGAEHIFLLTHPKETLEHLRRWVPASSEELRVAR